MKAIQVHEFGGPEVLKLEEIPTPKPAAGQVLVKVHAAGVNPYDTYMRSGTYAIKPPLPYTPGSDAAGVVEAVGDGVKKVKAGDRVYTAKTISGRVCGIHAGGRIASREVAGEHHVRSRRGDLGAVWHGVSRVESRGEGAGGRDGVDSRRERRRGFGGGADCAGEGAHRVWHGGNRQRARVGEEGRRASGVQSHEAGLHRRDHEGDGRQRRERDFGDARERELCRRI